MTFNTTGDGELAELINQVRDITQCSVDTAKTALFDSENDVSMAISYIMDNDNLRDQWQTSGTFKVKPKTISNDKPSVNSPEGKEGHKDKRPKKANRKAGNEGKFERNGPRKDHRRPQASVKSHDSNADKMDHFAEEPVKINTFLSDEIPAPTIDAWNGEAIKIVNSDARIALETCQEPAPVEPEVAEPPKMNGHTYPKQDEIMTKDVKSKKPLVATRFPLPSAVTVSSIAFDRRLPDNRHRKQFNIGDAEIRKLTANWAFHSNRHGSFFITNKPEPKEVAPTPAPVPERPSGGGITAENLVGNSRQYGAPLNKKMEENVMKPSYPAKQNDNMVAASKQQPSQSKQNISMHQTSNNEYAREGVTKAEVASQSSGVSAVSTALPMHMYTGGQPGGYMGHYGGPQTTQQQIFPGQQAMYASTGHQVTTANSVDQNFIQFNQMRQMITPNRVYMEQGRGHPQTSQVQHPNIHPHGVIDSAALNMYNQVVYLQNGFAGSQQQHNDPNGHYMKSTGVSSGQPNSANQPPPNSFHDSAILDSKFQQKPGLSQ
ncbi:hypothetical protein Ciccas_009238 [Cichlidogyrus casuarinus]|uniref:Uncharacterized protein n=1 Tax=Cichlidogyrus casuarinus TaxID=1844966 RepID=A0ABD2Q0D2_9PLAT